MHIFICVYPALTEVCICVYPALTEVYICVYPALTEVYIVLYKRLVFIDCLNGRKNFFVLFLIEVMASYCFPASGWLSVK